MTDLVLHTIPILPGGMLNAFLLVHNRRAVLVDTGLPNSELKIEQALRAHGLDWDAVCLTVLTHAHIDHAGSAVAVRSKTSGGILAHSEEVSYCKGHKPLLKPSGAFGRLFKLTGAIERPFDSFTPDHVMQGERYDLSDWGVPVRLLHTPGHTPGSISVLLEDGRVIAGDLAASGILLGGIAFRNRPKSPPFEEDRAKVAVSLETLLEAGARQFFLGHGGPLCADAITRHVGGLRRT